MTLVKSKELAGILGVTQRRVNQLAKDKVFERNGGCFDLAQSVQAYVTYTAAENDELRQEKTLHERAKRRKAEFELARLENRLHDAADVEQCLIGMLVTFRNRILSIPQKLAPQLLGLKNISEIYDLINEELRNALQELSEYDSAMFGGETDETE